MKARGNQVVLPINIASIIEEGDPVFKMAEILGELDYRKLRRTYKRRWRSISPEIMFSIVVFANMKGIYSSRGTSNICVYAAKGRAIPRPIPMPPLCG